MANSGRDLAKEQRWREVLAHQAASGLTARAFCRRESLTESAFYFWRRTIRARDGLIAPPAKSRRSHGPSSSRPAFVPVTVSGASRGEESIHLELVGGHVLRLPSSTSVAILVELVVGLETRRSP